MSNELSLTSNKNSSKFSNCYKDKSNSLQSLVFIQHEGNFIINFFKFYLFFKFLAIVLSKIFGFSCLGVISKVIPLS